MKITVEFSSLEEFEAFRGSKVEVLSSMEETMEVAKAYEDAPVEDVQPEPEPVPFEEVKAPEPVKAAEPAKEEKTYEQVQEACIKLMDAGKQDKLIDLLGAFGVGALPHLSKEKYTDFFNAVKKELGA